ncbi:rrna-processing protein efg1, partial [Cystoisospora suis]
MSGHELSRLTKTVCRGGSPPGENQKGRRCRFSGASWRKRKGQKTTRDKKAKAKARDLRRFLLKKKEGLSADAIDRLQGQIASLERTAHQSKKEERRKQFIVKRKKLYDKIKFYEGQKVRRRIRSTRRALSDLLKKRRGATGLTADEVAGLDAQIVSQQEVLQQHLDDLNYIARYPPGEAYVALFPSGGPVSVETQKKREEIRARIRERVVGERLENDDEDDGRGMHEDDFFLTKPAPNPAYSGNEVMVAATREVEDQGATAAFAQAPDLGDTDRLGGHGRLPRILSSSSKDRQQPGTRSRQAERAGRSSVQTARSDSVNLGGRVQAVGSAGRVGVPTFRQATVKPKGRR